MAKRKTGNQPFIRFVFLIYCITMLWLLFGRSYGWIEGLTYGQMLRQNMNLVPLYTINNYLRVILRGTNDALIPHCVINLVGNVVMFIPIGYLLPKLWKKLRNFFRFFFTCTGLILLVETVQLFTLLGSFDVDDLILNLPGMMIGYFICLLTDRKQ